MLNASIKPDERLRLRQLEPRLRQRQLLDQAIRDFFTARDFLEVNTPIRIQAPALEDYIDAEPAGPGWYLRTSPELHLKRLLAAGYPRLFQIGPCFRSGECGTRHQPEFTMLEWYRLNADYRTILADTRNLLCAVAERLNGDASCTYRQTRLSFAVPWEELTVDDAFTRYAGIPVDTAIATGDFEKLLVEKIEPRLGAGCPTVLMDFPLAFGALARRHPARPDRVERWELFLGGLEIANAYSELTDPEEQRRRFQACIDLRRREQREIYPLDLDFLAALDGGLPPCGGIALGVDRLAMVLTDTPDITHLLPFPQD